MTDKVHLQKLSERLLQLANDEGTAQIHDIALELARYATRTQFAVGVSASEVACYRWPEDTAEHSALRAAFVDGAAHVVVL